jgi:hypothetical protein
MNPIRRALEAMGLKPKTRKKRLPIVGTVLSRVGRRR